MICNYCLRSPIVYPDNVITTEHPCGLKYCDFVRNNKKIGIKKSSDNKTGACKVRN